MVEPPDSPKKSKPAKKSRGASRGTSRVKSYSKSATTTLVRGVKSCIDADIVSLKFTGAPVDLECPLRATHKVKRMADGSYYDVMLNQTNIASNNNKYYILQLLERVTQSGPILAVWFRWGRVGHINGTMLKEYDSEEKLDDAIADFSKKFFDKTRNHFDERLEFEKVNGKYDYIHRDYGDDVKDEEIKEEVKVEPCELDMKIQDLLNLICNTKMMEKHVKEMKFDIQKAPLGKLSQKQIDRGFAILKQIESVIKNGGVKLTKLSSQYFTHIPHDFGFRLRGQILFKNLLF